jgi:hypothetical protein
LLSDSLDYRFHCSNIALFHSIAGDPQLRGWIFVAGRNANEGHATGKQGCRAFTHLPEQEFGARIECAAPNLDPQTGQLGTGIPVNFDDVSHRHQIRS